MGLSSVATKFATGTYSVTRSSGAGSYDTNGDYTPAGTSVINVKASIQPLNGRELKVLPEGQHGAELRKVYSVTELKTRTPTSEPDIVSYKGEDWEVVAVEGWEAFGSGSGGDHYKAIIARTVTP
jgi:hypothetical protein